MMEAEAGETYSEVGGRGHEPRNTGNHQKKKKAKTQHLPSELLEGTRLLKP